MKKILVIDDDEQIRHILRRFLERAGYEVLEASNGQEGMALYRKEGPELVITDIIMPKKEGMETIMDMKGEFPKAKIIAISG
ncbi:MAG: response regulator, partial [Deltaproteobacteria bacterium]